MKEKEYLKLKKQLKDEYHSKLQAIETVWQMSGGKETKNGTGHKNPIAAAGQRGFIRSATRKAVSLMTGDFTVRTIKEKLGEDPELSGQITDLQLSSALARLAAKREIDVVEAGSGKRPSVYRKKDE